MEVIYLSADDPSSNLANFKKYFVRTVVSGNNDLGKSFTIEFI